jgi:hypothetical protein
VGGEEKRYTNIYGERPEGKENFGDLGLDEGTILNRIFKKLDGRART